LKYYQFRDELAILIERHIKKRAPGKFILPGLMKIEVKRKPATKARKGINPFTGEETIFKAKKRRMGKENGFGSEGFVESVKSAPGVMAKGGKSMETAGDYQPRQASLKTMKKSIRSQHLTNDVELLEIVET